MTAAAKKRSKAAQKAAQLARAEFRAVVFNLPNQLTWARLILAAVMFGLIALQYYFAGMVLFIIAASPIGSMATYARKYNQVTTLGRILDPFADKVIICGTFIYLAAIPDMHRYLWPSMAVIVVGRELLVTALRSFIEEQGGDFSAKMSGKLKMVLQCIAAGVSLFYLSRNDAVGQQIVRFVSDLHVPACGNLAGRPAMGDDRLHLVGGRDDRLVRRGLRRDRRAAAALMRNEG